MVRNCLLDGRDLLKLLFATPRLQRYAMTFGRYPLTTQCEVQQCVVHSDLNDCNLDICKTGSGLQEPVAGVAQFGTLNGHVAE